ncbi:MAG: hypothetical protein H7202_11485 [Pedobacter sp.]|nr:hypothetical protein [Pedobacter sp.]
MVSNRTELSDLSKMQPEKVQEMINLYQNWAQSANVISFEKLIAKKAKACNDLCRIVQES